jgi:VCBS repeat-containing protein
MNISQSLRKAFPVRAVLLVAAPLAATPALAVTYDLVASQFVKTIDGRQVTMWGYALDDGVSTPSVPGPALTVPPGDPTLTVNLRNAIPDMPTLPLPTPVPVSIVIPGLSASMAPVTFTDGQGRQRVRSFTTETAPGAVQSYTWNNVTPGTYLYYSGTHPAVQVQMGLYGRVAKDIAAGSIYSGVTYDNAATLFYSEVDPALHDAVANGSYGSFPTSTIDYAPKYFLINGEPYSVGAPPIPAGASGQKTLLRFLNAGLKTHAPVIQGTHVRLVAEDGKPYPYAREQYSVFLPAGKTVDAIMSPTGPTATYPVYDRRLHLTNDATPEGGMLTYLAVAGAAGAPMAVGDVFGATEDTPLSVAAPGVLANDTGTGTLSAVLVGSTSHGALSFAADGSFSYTPAANYAGSDSFTYRATDGARTSDPATVSISVAPVNDAPIAANNAYSVVQGGTLAVAVPGVLGNDSDPDGNALTAALVSGPAAGTLTLNADGSFNYVAPNVAGTQSFTYHASDGTLSSNAATVTLTVFANRAPVAVNDTVSAPARRTVAYTPVVINVLANDSDPDAPANTIDPATVTIATAPNKGGTVTINADGTLSYTPRLVFRGTETFSYRVRDTLGAQSNAATVRVNVR